MKNASRVSRYMTALGRTFSVIAIIGLVVACSSDDEQGSANAVPPTAALDSVTPQDSFRDFSEENLRGMRFTGEDLSNARFWSADLTGATFESSDLRFADFWGAELKDVSFIESDLSNANMYGADLEGALFKDSKLRYASFYATNMDAAMFENSPLCMVTMPLGESSGEC